jgi:hypothetical protein
MTSSKQKKFDKAAAIGFAVNFCAIFSLILVTGLLLAVDSFGGGHSGVASVSQALQNETSAVQACEPVVPAVLFPVSAPAPVEEPAVITVDDDGFSAKELNLASFSSKTVKIANRGANPHSFVVDELAIDSGSIAPGELATVFFDNVPQDVSSFNFHSGVAGDTAESFSGVVIIK